MKANTLTKYLSRPTDNAALEMLTQLPQLTFPLHGYWHHFMPTSWESTCFTECRSLITESMSLVKPSFSVPCLMVVSMYFKVLTVNPIYLISFYFKMRYAAMGNKWPLEIYNPTYEYRKATSLHTLRYLQASLKKCVSKVTILEFFVIFLFLEFIGTFLGMCSCAQCGYCEVSGGCTVQPLAYHGETLQRSLEYLVLGEAEKIAIGKKNKIKSWVGEKGPIVVLGVIWQV